MIHFVAEELDPGGMFIGGHEDVEQTTTYSELPAPLDHRHPLIAGPDQRLDDRVETRFVARYEHQGPLLGEVGGEGLHQRADRDQQHVGEIPGSDIADHRHTAAHSVGGGAQPLMGQGLPRREDTDCTAEIAQGVLHLLGLPPGCRHGDHRHGQPCQNEGFDAWGDTQRSPAGGQAPSPLRHLGQPADSSHDIGEDHGTNLRVGRLPGVGPPRSEGPSVVSLASVARLLT